MSCQGETLVFSNSDIYLKYPRNGGSLDANLLGGKTEII